MHTNSNEVPFAFALGFCFLSFPIIIEFIFNKYRKPRQALLNDVVIRFHTFGTKCTLPVGIVLHRRSTSTSKPLTGLFFVKAGMFMIQEHPKGTLAACSIPQYRCAKSIEDVAASRRRMSLLRQLVTRCPHQLLRQLHVVHSYVKCRQSRCNK